MSAEQPPVDTAPAPNPTIVIELTIETELTLDEVWPDGDAPKDWTAETVVAEVQKLGTVRKYLEDWDADTFGGQITVHVNGKYARGSLR